MIQLIEVKDGPYGANLDGLREELIPGIWKAARVFNERGHRFVITCGTDGEHKLDSLHPYGLAIDVRSRYLSKVEQVEILKVLQAELGSDYDVVLENDHFHIERQRIDGDRIEWGVIG